MGAGGDFMRGRRPHRRAPLFRSKQEAESAEEAKAWAESDPAVKAGRVTVEIHPWLVAKEVWP